MTKKEILQAMGLALLYVQSCAHTPQPFNFDMRKDSPEPLPTVEAQHDRLEKLMGIAPANAESAKAKSALSEMMASWQGMGLAPKDVRCGGVGCMVDVTYPDTKTIEKLDRQILENHETVFHKWNGSNGRTSARLVKNASPPTPNLAGPPSGTSGESIVATWYYLLPPTADVIERLKAMEGKQ